MITRNYFASGFILKEHTQYFSLTAQSKSWAARPDLIYDEAVTHIAQKLEVSESDVVLEVFNRV